MGGLQLKDNKQPKRSLRTKEKKEEKKTPAEKDTYMYSPSPSASGEQRGIVPDPTIIDD